MAESAGLVLDESQRFTLRCWMGERGDGSWAAFEAAHIMGRQNGKGAELEARQLAGLFVLGEELQLHTAHEFKTANEHFLRMAALVEGSSDLRRKVARIRYANGEQGIELRSGARLKFMARSGGSGRGFAGASTVYFDEAMYLLAAMIGAALPTLSAHWNPQVVYTGSAGFATSSQLHALRRRALSGDGGRLAYVEHTAESPRLVDGVVESDRDAIDPDDRVAWAAGNPTLGARIPVEFVEAERRSMPLPEFMRERLGVWEPEPIVIDAAHRVISEAAWMANVDDGAEARYEAFGIHVANDGRSAAIGWAGWCGDRRMIGVFDHRPGAGTGWLVPAVREIRARSGDVPIAVNPRSSALPLVAEIEQAAGSLVKTSAAEFAAACGAVKIGVDEHALCYRRQRSLEDALAAARQRKLSGAWAWEFPPGADDSPLVAVTLALHAHMSADVSSLEGSLMA